MRRNSDSVTEVRWEFGELSSAHAGSPIRCCTIAARFGREQSLVGGRLLLLFVPIPHLSYFCLFNGNQKGVTPNTGLGSSWDKACEDHGSMG